MDEIGGMEEYAKIVARDFTLAREAAAKEAALETKNKRLALEYHRLFTKMATDVDRGEIDVDRLQFDRQDALAIVMEELRGEIAHNPELRKAIAKQLADADMGLLLDLTGHIHEQRKLEEVPIGTEVACAPGA